MRAEVPGQLSAIRAFEEASVQQEEFEEEMRILNTRK